MPIDNELLESAPCPLCEADVPVEIYPATYPAQLQRDELLSLYRSSSENRLYDRLVRCSLCNMVYTNPRVRADIINQSYRDARDDVFISQNEQRISTFRKTLSRLKSLHHWTPSRMRHLDVGCAGGACLVASHSLGFHGEGVEPNRWLCEYCSKEYGLRAHPGLLQEQGFEDGQFDLLSLFDVIEHVPDPTDLLKECIRVLKPGGFLLVNFPDFGSWPSIIMGRKWPFLLGVHLHYYTRSTLKRQLSKHPVELLSWKPYWQSLQLGYVCHRASQILPPMKILSKFISCTPLFRLPVAYQMGQTLCVAKKTS